MAEDHPECEVVGALDRESRVLRILENVHPEPAHNFKLKTQDAYEVHRDCDLFLHSHAPGFEWPSERDLEIQIQEGIGWCILPREREAFYLGDTIDPSPLLARPFRHGLTDCYGLVRDWYNVEGLPALSNYPRRWQWWRDGESLYELAFTDEGFRDVMPESGILPQLYRGDVLLMQIRSPVPNHTGVYSGLGSFLHHPSGSTPYDPTQRSRYAHVERFRKYITRVLRREQVPA